MSTDQEVVAAQQQVRETLVATGMRYADRLRALRAEGLNFNVAIAKGGGLALIFVKGNHEQGPHLRFGAPDSGRIAQVNAAEVERWNRANPNHEVEMMPIQPMLDRECGRLFSLLLELHASIARSELKSSSAEKEG